MGDRGDICCTKCGKGRPTIDPLIMAELATRQGMVIQKDRMRKKWEKTPKLVLRSQSFLF